jgi:phage shock protein C
MAETRKLYRSRTNRQVAGVCGGLAQYFNLDATLLRILFVVLAVPGGSGLPLYVAMWNRPQRAVSRGMIQQGMVHPIPVAGTESHDLGKCWLAWRLAVDLYKDEAAGSSPARPNTPRD